MASMTPAELQAHATSLLSSSEKVGGGKLSYMLNSVSRPDNAKNSCFGITSAVHKFMPEGSKIVRIMQTNSQGEAQLGGHHYLHHVPTTEGPYVVDYTHRQFDSSAPHPLVEPLDSFNQRSASQQRSSVKVLSNRSATAAASAADTENNRKSYELQMRWQRRHDRKE